MGQGGRESVAVARSLSLVTIGVGFMIITFAFVALFLLRKPFISLYTSDPEVADLSDDIWTPAALYVIPDGALALLTGVVRGLGLQGRMAVVVVLVLWAVGLPCVLHVVFSRGNGIVGLWMSVTPLYVVLDITLAASCICLDWQTVSDTMQAEKQLLDEDQRLRLEQFADADFEDDEDLT